MRIYVVIPVRYGSTRLPGKALHPRIKEATGKHLIQHVYERAQAAKLVDDVIVATDDERIVRVVEDFGGRAVMTSDKPRNGTERVAEVAQAHPADAYINVQGDEAEIAPEAVDAVARMLREDPLADIATLANVIETEEELNDPACVKVVLNDDGFALYFSRSPIPFVRDVQADKMNAFRFLRHIGVYGYRREFLLAYPTMPQSDLERAEKLEQLRALSRGYRIRVAVIDWISRGIDTEADMEDFIRRYKAQTA